MIGNPLLLGDEGYQIQRSLRFRSSASADLNRTPASAGNRQIYTRSVWIKRGALSSTLELFSAGAGNVDTVRFTSSDNLLVRVNNNDSTSTRVFRDPSAWGHLVVAIDTTQATSTNRMKAYWNNELITWSTYAVPAQNTQTEWDNNANHNIGSTQVSTNYFDGYLAEFYNIDGQALTPSSFGAINATTGVWSATKYAGTYGTNGFYLPFTDNSAATATTIGKDFSGNGNNWTPNNISVTAGVTYDSMLDAPLGAGGGERGNYATLNPLDKNAGTTPSNANLTWTASTPWRSARATFGMTFGKWYWEVTASGANNMYGIGTATAAIADNNYPGKDANGWGYFDSNGNKFTNGSGSSYGASYTTNDVIGVAFDADNGTLTFYKNGTSQGTAFTGLTSGPYFPMVGNEGSTSHSNFGQRPFSYTPPTGFKALHTGNLGAPVIALPAQNMAATLYTGNSSTQTISNAVNSVSFQPDFVWIKRRSSAVDHKLGDSVRGTTKYLISNTTDAESTEANGVTSFNSNGFTLGSGLAFNYTGETYVGWQWKAGGTAVSNTAGSITSSVSANVSAGFSVVTYTGNGTNGATVGHGLGAVPSMIIIKVRNAADNWPVYHKSLGNTDAVFLNLTTATQALTYWNSTTPSSTVFTLGSNLIVNKSSDTFVAYCFAPVAGYSAFGSYTGNGSSTDGPFVYLGFRPRFVMIKKSSGVGNWVLLDTSRGTYNAIGPRLYADLSDAEYTGDRYDILSNGFKVRTTSGESNDSGGTYIYMAFAESPFKSALGR